MRHTFIYPTKTRFVKIYEFNENPKEETKKKMSHDLPPLNYDELREKLLGLTLERKRLERDLELEAAVTKEKQTIRKAHAPLALSRETQNMACSEGKKPKARKPVDGRPVFKEFQNSKVAFGSSVPAKPVANIKQLSRKAVPPSNQFMVGQKSGQAVQYDKGFDRIKQVIAQVGGLTRVSCQVALQSAGGAIAIAMDESQTVEVGIKAACLAAYAARLVTLLSYPDELCRTACKAPDLAPASNTLADAMRMMLNVEVDACLPPKPLVLALVSTGLLFVTGKNLDRADFIRETLASLPQSTPDLSILRIALLECAQSWRSYRSLPFREAAMMTTRTCLERLGQKMTMSAVETVIVAAVLGTSFNLARRQSLTPNRAGFCVAILASWQHDPAMGTVSGASLSSSSSASSPNTKRKSGFQPVEKIACFAVMAAVDDLWRRVRETYDGPIFTPLKPGVSVAESEPENPLLECAMEFHGELRQMLVKAATRLSEIVEMLERNRIKRIEMDIEIILQGVETGYFEVRRKISENAAVDVALDALESRERSGATAITTRTPSVGERLDNVEEENERRVELLSGLTKPVLRLKERDVSKEPEDEDQASDEASPRVPTRRVRPITQRAPISASPPARSQQSGRPTVTGSSKQRLFDDWTSESSSSWLSETGELSPDEVRAFSSHLNDARSVAARYGIFQTTHPEDVGRLLEPLPFSTRY